MAFKFEKLKFWQRAVDLSGEIYEPTEFNYFCDFLSELIESIQAQRNSIK